MSRLDIVTGLLQQPDSPNRVACAGDGCDATTLAPRLGVPADWEAIFKSGCGWTLICPGCLDAIEDEYLSGGGTWQPFGAAGCRHDR